MASDTKVLIDGLCFPEGPRWHDGQFWFSDMHDQRVVRASLDGRSETVVRVPERPSGLGWLPDGRMLVVSMQDRRLMRLDPGGLTPVADLSQVATFHVNDMVVDRAGRAYVGNFGFDLVGGAQPKTTSLARVDPDGRVSVAATDLMFPNGTVITPDDRTLVVGESFGNKLTAFDKAPDGTLSKRRVWAALEGGAIPDGIALDAEGAIWVASPTTGECLRVHEGGRVSRRLRGAGLAYACALGGPERKTLFVCTAETHDPAECVAKRTGRIEIAHVDVAGAGWP
ncbi:MAG TPA: SMP-30/gluconolactonase/LRE family protein [Myxococcota bacterium]|nr:SMP-30/gluconolactonase/LRE family protein [Myxococcota bacterium]